MWMFALLGPARMNRAIAEYNRLAPKEQRAFQRKYGSMLARTIERRVKLFQTPSARKVLGERFCENYIARAPERLKSAKRLARTGAKRPKE